MDIREALYTTRAMRRVKPDPIPMDVQQRILDAAIRAPSGGNAQQWRFLLVDDADIKAKLGPIYRDCLGKLFATIYKPQLDAAAAAPDKPESMQFRKMHSSASHLAEHFEQYPLLLFGFCRFDPSGGSIFPSIWSAMLAARAEGVGSAITSVLAFEGETVMRHLGVPEGEGWQMHCCITMGYPTGRWGIAPRVPVQDVASRNQWGQPIGFEVNSPLWSPED
jgi:nitroreductase